MNNKWTRAAIPALLIHCSVGTVYCWSAFKQAIAEQIGMSAFSVGWAFSLAIFFLGMSAAFAGTFVERDIHKSSMIACICFSVGMIGTGFVINFLSGITALIGVYLFYGVIMGIGLGVGYLSPVKTLMLWFPDNKGLATGLSIMGFGLAKAIATPIMMYIQNHMNISSMFYILGVAYFVLMFIGHLLLKKPDGWVEPTNNQIVKIKDRLQYFKQKKFLGIWLMFFLNIHCGLMIISYEKQLLSKVFIGTAILATMLSIIPSVTAGFNALGRIGYSTISDKMKTRSTIYKIIFITSAVITLLTIASLETNTGIMLIIIVYLCIINAGYGGGFSTLPTLLSENYGMKQISQIHGLTLSAWAIAGLTGNNTSEIVLSLTNQNYSIVLIVQLCLYLLALIIYRTMVIKE